MNKRERVFAALKGQPVDRPPVALWRHFPEQDQTPAGLAEAVTDWQTRWGWDFVKVTPTSGYYIEDWGATFEYRPEGNVHGTRTVLSRPIQSREALRQLKPLDVEEGVYGRELRALEILRDRLDENVPVLQTIFSPLNTAHSLMGDFFNAALQAYPADFRQAMDVITEVTTEFALASLRVGADSLFYATQMAQPQVMTADQYRTWGIPYDLEVIGAVRDHTDFLLLHIHGDEIYFDLLVKEYPVDAVNWHTRIAGPSLAKAQDVFDGAVVGGLTEDVLTHGSPEAIRAQVVDAIQQTGGRRVIVGAGCVTLITAPEVNIATVRETVEEWTES